MHKDTGNFSGNTEAINKNKMEKAKEKNCNMRNKEWGGRWEQGKAK
jgi:hypothetical protein